jgi:hypothetical protein
VAIKNRQQLLAILALTGLALLLGDSFVVKPLTKSWKERSARITDLRKKITQGKLVIDREESIHSRWNHMQTNTLPENVSAAETQVLRAFDRWSRDSRISISSLKPQWKRAGEDFTTLEYRCDAFGSMQAVLRFLHTIEKDPMALRIESVEITSRDNNGDQLALALQVSGLLLGAEEQQP